MNWFSNYVMPFLFTCLSICALGCVVLGFSDLKNTNEYITNATQRAVIPDTIFFHRMPISNPTPSFDSLIVDKTSIKESISELKLISSQTLNNNTISFLFTFFSIALLTAGVYILSIINGNLSKFKKEHDSILSDSLNSELTLALLFNIDFVYNQIITYSNEDSQTAPARIRESLDSSIKILKNKSFSKLQKRIYSTLIHKLKESNRKIKLLIENRFQDDEGKKRAFQILDINIKKIEGLIKTKQTK